MNELAQSSSKSLASDVPRRAGLEHVDPEDVTWAELMLMHGQSQLVQKHPEKYRVGQFVNSLTEQVVDAPEFIPVSYDKYYEGVSYDGDNPVVEFRTTDKLDTRLAGREFFNSDAGKATARITLRFVCLIGKKAMLLRFSKTSLKAGKRIIGLAMDAGGPLYANRYKLTTASKTNGVGKIYWVKEVQLIGPAGPEELALAQELHLMLGTKVPAVSDAIETE